MNDDMNLPKPVGLDEVRSALTECRDLLERIDDNPIVDSILKTALWDMYEALWSETFPDRATANAPTVGSFYRRAVALRDVLEAQLRNLTELARKLDELKNELEELNHEVDLEYERGMDVNEIDRGLGGLSR